MANGKSMFRNILDAMIEARSKQAAREVANYRASMKIDADGNFRR